MPMTLQKQNAVTAVIADVLTPSAVWYIRCIAVRQTSPMPGSNISRAVVSLVVQQDANALWIGQVSTPHAFVRLALAIAHDDACCLSSLTGGYYCSVQSQAGPHPWQWLPKTPQQQTM